MKRHLFSLLAALPSLAGAQERPNVLLIIADDLGYGDVSAYGSQTIQTPNIDRLAQGGVCLTNGHASSATSTPSRYGLLTGIYPWRRKTNILPGDVYVRAKELHFVTDEPRIVLLVRQVDSADVAAMEVIHRLFPDKQRDFGININETDIVVVKALSSPEASEEVLKAAHSVENALHDELGIKCVIGVSTTANHLRELADRYKEAQVAIDVGRVFDADKSIINYENLGLGRIIYQLPTTLCEMFLNEVFKKNPIETLDEDTLETINKFFENNLNVSETSRKLYVHRNTLVYRLEKIKKLTGLDLREFDHAIVFKVAMMVKMYLDSLNTSKH